MTFNLDPQYAQQIVEALANSASENGELRQAATESLKQAEKTKGYASALLKISGDTTLKGAYPIDINHAASIQFGRLVDTHWKFKTKEQAESVATSGFDYTILDDQDKQCVRENILDAIYQQVSNKLIQKQYIRSMKMICIQDYPDNLPNVLGQIMAYLQKNDQVSVFAGLQGLYALCSRYEFELDEQREPLYDIVEKTFVVLGPLVNDMMANRDNEDALFMLHLICKVFYTSNQLQMTPFLMEKDTLHPWFAFFKEILDMPVPPELAAPTEETEEI